MHGGRFLCVQGSWTSQCSWVCDWIKTCSLLVPSQESYSFLTDKSFVQLLISPPPTRTQTSLTIEIKAECFFLQPPTCIFLIFKKRLYVKWWDWSHFKDHSLERWKNSSGFTGLENKNCSTSFFEFEKSGFVDFHFSLATTERSLRTL